MSTRVTPAHFTPRLDSTPSPHAVVRYQAEQRALEAERLTTITALLHVDAFLERASRVDALDVSAPVEEEPAPLWMLAVGVAAWTALLVIGLGLMAVKLGWIA